MNLYVPNNYFKLYSNITQSNQTLRILKLYTTKDDIITDATSGIGGNSVVFSKYYKSVNCVEIDYKAYSILNRNLKLSNNIKFYNNNYLDVGLKIVQDVIFIDPPWERGYKRDPSTNLYLSTIPIINIIDKLSGLCKIVALKCPMNYNVIFKNWEYTTHYIYNGRRVVYKIIILEKFSR